MVWLWRNSATDIFFSFPFLDGGFQSFLNMQNHFQSWHKVTNIARTDITLMSLLQYLDTFFIYFYVLEESECRLEEFYKKGALKYSTQFTGKHLRWGLLCNKAAGWRPVTSGAFLWIFWNLYINIYFANVCEGMPLIIKIFTGVSFCKMLSFYYKRKRQLFYYEGTSSSTLKIPERVNRVISQNSSELLLMKVPQQTKTCSKSTKKECFRNVFRKSSGLYINNSEGVRDAVSF